MDIRIAESEADRQKIFHLRYMIYIKEMHRPQPFADSESEIIVEPLDNGSIIIGCFDGSRAVGTVRINFLDHTDLIERDIYDLDFVASLTSRRIAFLSKLMILPVFRSSLIFERLCKAAYEIGLKNGVEIALMDCNEHLVETFLRLGFVSYKGKVNHPLYGTVVPMLLMVEDSEHLKTMGSPFYPVWHRFQNLTSCLEARVL